MCSPPKKVSLLPETSRQLVFPGVIQEACLQGVGKHQFDAGVQEKRSPNEGWLLQ